MERKHRVVKSTHTRCPILAGVFLGALLSTGCHKDESLESDMGMAAARDLRHTLASATATFSWPQGPTLDKYDFSNLVVRSDMPTIKEFYLRGDWSDNRWRFQVNAEDVSIPAQPKQIFELLVGWTPSLFWTWFGDHPANYLSLTVYFPPPRGTDTYCFATVAANNGFLITPGTDSAGKYIDVVAGPITVGKVDSSTCNNTAPRTSAGDMNITFRYRCNNIDDGFQGFPHWAKWVCE